MSNIPKYKQVYEYILNQINEGRILPNDKLLSEEEYSNIFGVSMITIRKAMSELAADNIIHRIKGKGSFVSDPIKSNYPVYSNLIALILSADTYKDTSYLQIIQGAQKTAADMQYSLIVEWGDQSCNREKEIIQKMISQKVDGIMIYPFDPIESQPYFDLITKEGIPYLLIDRYNPKFPSLYVGSNNFEGGSIATQKLLELGHTRIKFIGYHFFLSSERERYAGYCSAMCQADLYPDNTNLIINVNYNELAQQIRSGLVTALCCSNDRIALNTIRALMNKGIKIPEQVSIIGFDDWKDNNASPVRLTTIKQNFEMLGSLSSSILISAAHGKTPTNNAKMLLGVELIIRDTICENKKNL